MEIPVMKQDFIPFKPFRYPFAYESFKEQNKVHWVVTELSLTPDVKDFKQCSEEDKKLILDIFSFFTQSDILVNDSYNQSDLTSHYSKFAEVSMMLSAFSNAEAIHIDAYSQLIETLNIDESIYSKFLENPFLVTRYELSSRITFALHPHWRDGIDGTLFRAFYNHIYLEGVSLFGMFATLLHFNRNGKFQNMGQVLTWSMRDENLHVKSMTVLLSHYISENRLHEQIPRLISVAINLWLTEFEYMDTIITDKELLSDLKQYMSFLIQAKVHNIISEVKQITRELKSVGYYGDEEVISDSDWENIEKLYMLSSLGKSNFKIPQWIIDSSGLENVNYFVTSNTSYTKLNMNETIEIVDL